VAALIFAVVDCIFNVMYLEWLWIPDWCMVIFNLLSYYLIELTAFSLFGIFSAYIFFGKKSKAILLTVLAFVGTVIFPFSRYFIGHMLLADTMYDTAMLSYFSDNVLFVQTLLMNALLLLIAVLLTKLFSGILYKNPADVEGKMFSLRNPLNLAALIFCAAAVLLASVLFVSVGDFSFEGVLSLFVEYVINAVRFVVIVFTAFKVRTALSSSGEAEKT
jgi:hypothetical protein